MKKNTRQSRRMISKVTRNIIKAHQATGEVTLADHEQKMRGAVNKAIKGDKRFAGMNNYSSPYCCDITAGDGKEKHEAIIYTGDSKAVRHGFDYDKEKNEAKMHDGDPKETHMTRIYASMVERHENMIKAMQEVISCRASNGTKIDASAKWEAGKSVSYIFVPGGISTITAGFRKNETITCTVEVDEDTAKDLQESFDHITATEKQEPYADEDHESKKATLRFPADKIQFTYGTLRNEEGVIVKGAEPTTYGAESVNGKVYRSWSPEFATDADYTKAKSKKGHWTFPDGVRGSASNPARIIAVNFVTGALTNKPAFRNMPPVKAKKEEAPQESRFIIAARELDSEAICELRDLVTASANNTKGFQSDICICSAIEYDEKENQLSATIKTSEGKFLKASFEENNGEIEFGESEEISDKDSIAAFDAGFLFNDEVIKAAGTSDSVRKAWETRHRGGTDQKWESSEASAHVKKMDDNRKQSLPDRKSAEGEVHSHMKEPESFAQRADWVLEGSYGRGAQKAAEMAMSSRGNRHAMLTQIVGHYEHNSPSEHTNKAWHKLSPDEQKNLHAHMDAVIKHHDGAVVEGMAGGKTKASDKTEESEIVKSVKKPEPTSLEKLFEKVEKQRGEVDSIAARIPAVATRGDLEKIYAKVGAK